MGYSYMTPKEFAEHTGLTEAGIAAIEPGSSMTLQAMMTLQDTTMGRFNFKVDGSGLFATCRWINYYQTDGGNYKIDDDTGAAVLEDLQEKMIIIG